MAKAMTQSQAPSTTPIVLAFESPAAAAGAIVAAIAIVIAIAKFTNRVMGDSITSKQLAEAAKRQTQIIEDSLRANEQRDERNRAEALEAWALNAAQLKTINDMVRVLTDKIREIEQEAMTLTASNIAARTLFLEYKQAVESHKKAVESQLEIITQDLKSHKEERHIISKQTDQIKALINRYNRLVDIIIPLAKVQNQQSLIESLLETKIDITLLP